MERKGKTFPLSLSLSLFLGACTYDVGEGVPQKQTRVLISCVLATLTKGGQKIKKISDVIRTCPPLSLLCGVAQSVMKKVIKLALPLLQGRATIADRVSTTFFGANLDVVFKFRKKCD